MTIFYRIYFRWIYVALTLVALTGAQANLAWAADDLKGFIYLNADNCEKGKTNANCIINFQVSGDGARALYEKMKAKAIKDDCAGGMMKTDDSGLHCYVTDGKTYDCDFGYNFARKKIVGSDVDC
jgi:hypothetical protein